MSLKSDVNVDPAKFDRKNIDQETLDFNQKLIKIWADGPRWYEVRSPHLTHPFGKVLLHQLFHHPILTRLHRSAQLNTANSAGTARPPYPNPLFSSTA
jgi:hypothetical protein